MNTFWDGLGSGDFGDKGNHFEIGSYILKIDRIFTHAGFTGHSLILAFEVHWSNNGVPAGSARDTVLKLDDAKRAKMIQADINAFVFAAFGKSKDDRTFDAMVKPLIVRAPGASNPFSGGFLKLEAYNIKVGDAKDRDFTKLKWMPADAGYNVLDVATVMAHPAAVGGPSAAPAMMVYGGVPVGQVTGLQAPPPPPPGALDPAKARALATPGWTLPDGRWYNGAAWVGP